MFGDDTTQYVVEGILPSDETTYAQKDALSYLRRTEPLIGAMHRGGQKMNTSCEAWFVVGC